MVLVAVENFYYGQYLDQAAWKHTDQQGRVGLTLGDSRNFWILAAADLAEGEVWAPYSIPDIQSGSYPNWFLKAEAGDPTIAAADAVAGASFDVPIQLGGHVGRPVLAATGHHGEPEIELRLDLGLDATLLEVPAKHTFLGWYAGLGYAYGGGLIQPQDTPGTVDVYLVDAANYALFTAGEPFEALAAEEGTVGGVLDFDFDSDSAEIYVLISNRGSPRHVHHGTAGIEATSGFLRSGSAEDCGCTAGPRGPRAWALGLLAVVGLAGVRRRDRLI
jgi:MYXO-CTERM domain-containing protein